MPKLQLTIIAVFLTLFAAAVPFLTCFYLAWIISIDAEEHTLREIGFRALKRTQITFNDAYAVLTILNQSEFSPCSDEHINYMRNMATRYGFIEEISYYSSNILQCTSWGIAKTPESLPSHYITCKNGLSGQFNAQIPTLGISYLNEPPKILTTLFFLKNYSLLVNEKRYSDIIAARYIHIFLFIKTDASIQSINNLIPIKPSINFQHLKKIIAKHHVISIVKKDNLIAIITEPFHFFYIHFKKNLWLLLPFAIFFSFIIISIAYIMIRHRLSLLGELQSAIENDEINVYYQPIMDAKSGFCIGAEALVKWIRFNGELVEPDIFIQLAEQNNLILSMTDHIASIVIYEIGDLLAKNKTLHVAINLSVEDIKTDRFLNVIESLISHTHISRHQIWLEATEHGFIDLLEAKKTISKAQKLGYIIAIDDFGTGYSSLSTLQELPLDVLKIDKQFVKNIEQNSVVQEMISHIIQIGKTLSLKIVVEGIEKKEQLEFFMDQHIEYAQGFYFSKPLSAADFEYFYKKYQHRSFWE